MYNLSQIPLNVVCIVREVQEGDLGSRLLDMGLVPGTELVRVLSAPGGDPLAFTVNGDYILGLRVYEAEAVAVYFPT